MTKRSRPRRLLAAGSVAIVLGALASTASVASASTAPATAAASASATKSAASTKPVTLTGPARIAAAPLAVSCPLTLDLSQSFTHNGTTYLGFWYASHYSGLTTVPSTTKVTSSGEEAQCLLAAAGFSPGTIDDVFGAHSQAAMHAFQTYMNTQYNASLATGPGEGLPGPNSWKWLRRYG